MSSRFAEISFTMTQLRTIIYSFIFISNVASLLTLNETTTTTTVPPMIDCWSSKPYESCVIRTTLYMLPAQERSSADFGLLLDIDCTEYNGSTVAEKYTNGLTLPRTAGKRHALLDGCHAPIGAQSYGLEYLDNCAELLTAIIERFNGDETLPIHCAAADAADEDLQLTELIFRHNEIATIGYDSFERLKNLRILEFESNALYYIDCINLPLMMEQPLERLAIRQEPMLALKNATLFKEFRVRQLEFVALNYIEAELLAQLPQQLEQLTVAYTPIKHGKITLRNTTNALVNLTLVHCGITEFQLEEHLSNMQLLNLSGNAIRKFVIAPTNPLQILDLSENNLAYLEIKWFQNLATLKEVYLSGNTLKLLSLPTLLQLAPQLQYVDLHDNFLTQLTDIMNARTTHLCANFRIKIDANPWSCIWLVNFAHTRPELFCLFQYDKFISQLNVNGLACQTQEPQTEATKQSINASNISRNDQTLNKSAATPPPMNVSTFTLIYGTPWEGKRSQKSEAMIIMLLVPLGIIFLFVLLYLWLNCQKLFHLSFYRFDMPYFGCCKTHANGNNNTKHFAERFDVVRYPANASSINTMLSNGDISYGFSAQEADGYETPVSGVPSICNCQNITLANDCHKTHHVTYEALPIESPYQIYAEIKEHNDTDSTTTSVAAVELRNNKSNIYDHLTFNESDVVSQKLSIKSDNEVVDI